MKIKGKFALVTGGAGFIGSHLVERLISEGASVRILDKLSTGEKANVPNSDKVEFLRGDVRNLRHIRAALEDIELVFHEAAQINPVKAVENPLYDFEVNARGTLNLLLESIREGVEKFIMASTNTYGDANTDTMSENFSTLFEKKSLLSPYAAAKVCAEAYLKVANDELGMPTVRLRYFNVYGPRQSSKSESGVVAIFTEQALSNKSITIFGDGTQTRDFVYVSDVVEANMLAASRKQANGDVFNIGSGRETSIIKLAKLIVSVTGRKIPIKFTAPRSADFKRAKADLRRVKHILGFQPKVKLEDGIRRYVNWFTKNMLQS